MQRLIRTTLIVTMMYKVTQGGIRQHHHDSKKDLEAVLKELRDDVQPFMRVPGCVHGSHNYKLCTTLTREHAGHVWGEREQVVPVGQITD